MKLSKLALSVLLALAANQSQAVDLIEVYQAAQGQDAAFASAKASRQAGQEKQSQGRSYLMPSVNLTANSTFNDINVQFPTGSRDLRYNNSGYGVSLVQPLFRQQNWMAYSSAEMQVVISEAQYQAAQHDLILRVAQGYFDVLVAKDNVQLTEAQKQAISEQLEQAKRNFEVGTATITDTYEAQARYDLILAQEINAQSNLEVKKRALQQITNVSTGELRQLGQELKLETPQPLDVEKWVEDAQLHNVQITIAEAAAQLADKEVSRTLGGHLPTIDLVANYAMNSANGGTFNGTGYGAADTTSKVVGVQLNMPLFQGGATQSKYREADANREKAKQDLENARRSVAVQTRQAYLGVASGIAQVKALQQALKSSESLLEASKLGQGVGVRTNLDVLNAQQQLFSTRRDLYQAEYNYLISRLRLKAAVGTLTDEDIKGVNQALR
ncbi:MAG: TolC family outer membrane protein [Gallionellaceae bacterium]|nr:TolC family outer membrane protein [Gallionellaceae bacterium]